MAIASQSLFNMSVSADSSPSNQGLLMPKLQYRFRVNFLNFGTTTDGIELTKQVIDCQRPNVSFTEITLPVYNSTVYLAGKHAWQPLTVNVRDDANGSVARSVGQQLQKQMDFVEQASAVSGQDYKFEMNIDILDGGNGGSAPVVLERWDLQGCFLQAANYNTLNYGTSEAVTIGLTIRFDNAVQAATPGAIGDATGVGVAVGRTVGSIVTGNG